MTSFTTGPGFSVDHLVNDYPWEDLQKRSTIVDIGGSTGEAGGIAIARKFHKDVDFKVIAQDLPQVIAGVTNTTMEEANEIGLSFEVHDFFRPQPVEGGNVYLFRWILHNWPDACCTRILRALTPALRRGTRVLVMEMVLPPPGLAPNDVERKLRAIDLTMLEIGNAREARGKERSGRSCSQVQTNGFCGNREGSSLRVVNWQSWSGCGMAEGPRESQKRHLQSNVVIV